MKKMNIMGQDVCNVPSISINEHTLDVVQDFTYFGSTVTSNLSTDVEINKCIGKASSAMSRLTNRVCENGTLTLNTRVKVYKACVLSILLYGGTIKQEALKASLQATVVGHILTAKNLYDWGAGHLLNIKLFFISKEEVSAHVDQQENRYSNAKTVPGTWSYHCFVPNPTE